MTKQPVHTFPARISIVLLTFVGAVAAALSIAVPIASAHTDFDSSTPSDGDTVAEPVSVVTLEFTGVSEPAGDGFVVLTPDGEVRTPVDVSTTDSQVFDLTFDPPLAPGQIGVRWSVRAPDAHPVEGSFSFMVTAPGSAAVESGDEPVAPDVDAAQSDATAVDRSASAASADAAGSTAPTTESSLDDFLAVDYSTPGELASIVGRVMGYSGLAFAIGGLAFVATTLRGRRKEVESAIVVVRVVGIVITVGALVEYVGVSRIAGEAVSGYWSSSPGFAALLRAAGGVAIAAGLVAVTSPVRPQRSIRSLSAAADAAAEVEREDHDLFWADRSRRGRARRADGPVRILTTPDPRSHRRAPPPSTGIDPLMARSLAPRTDESVESGAMSRRRRIEVSTMPEPGRVHTDGPVADRREPAEGHVIRRWVADRSSWLAFTGVTLAVLSFWFDGHTVSKGSRLLHALVNSVHVVAGSVWLGSVVAMALVLWFRHRAGRPPRALEMVVRFSGIATVALGAVVAAGGLMAFLVLDSPVSCSAPSGDKFSCSRWPPSAWP